MTATELPEEHRNEDRREYEGQGQILRVLPNIESLEMGLAIEARGDVRRPAGW